MVEANAYEPAELRSLPAAMGAWELSVRPAPEKLGTPTGCKLVVVADGRSGMLRTMRVIEQVTGPAVLEAVALAMRASSSGLIACRPRELAVDGLRLARLLARPLERCGVKVLVAPSVPTVDCALAALREHGEDLQQPEPAAGQRRPPLGSKVLGLELAEVAARIADLEPWRYLDGELPLLLQTTPPQQLPRVLAVHGQPRQPEGVSCFTDADAYRRGFALGVPSASWWLHFVHASQLSRAEREAFAEQRLPVAHGLYPRFAVISGGGEALDLQSEPLARAIVGDLLALVALLERSLHDLLEGRPAQCTDIPLPDGRLAAIEARPELMMSEANDELDEGLLAALALEMSRAGAGTASPTGAPLGDGGEPPLLYGGRSHRLMLASVPHSVLDAARGARLALWRAEQQGATAASEVQAVVVKMLKRDAERVLPRLSDVDRVRVRRSPFGGCVKDTLLAYTGERLIGSLGSWVTPLDAPDPLDHLPRSADAQGTFVLFVSGGGDRWMRVLKPQAIVGALWVRLELDDEEATDS